MSDGLLKRAMDKLSGRKGQVDTAVSKATSKGKDGETEAARKKREAKEKRDKEIADNIRKKRAARAAPQL